MLEKSLKQIIIVFQVNEQWKQVKRLLFEIKLLKTIIMYDVNKISWITYVLVAVNSKSSRQRHVQANLYS